MFVGSIPAIFLFLGSLAAAQTTADERQVIRLIEQFRGIAKVSDAAAKKNLLSDHYVHVTEDGAMTTAWRILRDQIPAGMMEHLSVQLGRLR